MKSLGNISTSHVITLKQWFDSYVENLLKKYPDKRENLELKRLHTYNVCKESLKITLTLNKSQECRLVAYTIALFHDLGRFYQFIKYNTFNDKISQNHSQLSIDIIQQNNLLKNFTDYAKYLILTSIKNHNLPKLLPTEDEKITFLSKIIRDADKIDIYKIIIQNYKLKNSNKFVNLELPDSKEISENVYSRILNKECVRYEDLKTLTDLKLLHLSWVFDINFFYTLETIKKTQYLEQIYVALPYNTQTKKIYAYIKNYLDKRLKTTRV